MFKNVIITLLLILAAAQFSVTAEQGAELERGRAVRVYFDGSPEYFNVPTGTVRAFYDAGRGVEIENTGVGLYVYVYGLEGVE